ncbi:hypothetical protein [Paracoccus nototheniae]|nr:hypothetical protein [Paracoccus nototheniae]
MVNLPFNPHAGDVRIASVAAFVGCKVPEVEAAFGKMFAFALWAAERSESGDARKEAKALRDAAAKFKAAFPHLTEIHDDMLREAAVAEHFTDPKAYPGTKGRKERARIIADGIARLFANTGRNIGIGKSPYSGDPSTPFGRAVQHALATFEIEANWYQPAHSAAKRARCNTN